MEFFRLWTIVVRNYPSLGLKIRPNFRESSEFFSRSPSYSTPLLNGVGRKRQRVEGEFKYFALVTEPKTFMLILWFTSKLTLSPISVVWEACEHFTEWFFNVMRYFRKIFHSNYFLTIDVDDGKR